jgi:uncharacterized protein (DUF1684 family)
MSGSFLRSGRDVAKMGNGLGREAGGIIGMSRAQINRRGVVRAARRMMRGARRRGAPFGFFASRPVVHIRSETVMPGFAFAFLVTSLLATSPAGTASSVHAARPTALSHAAADSVRQAILKDRADTEAWLKSEPTSYLATILRRDFGSQSTLTVGRAADNDVRVVADSIGDHHLRITVVGDSFHVSAVDAAADFRVQKEVRREATLGPSSIGVGRFTVRLSHQRFPALIVFDPKSPRYAAYKGIPYYPVDLRYYFELPLTPNPQPDTIHILSTRGNRRRAVRVGWFDFMVAGRRCRLEATRLLEPGVGEGDISVFFRDATTGRETYEVGRYVDPKPVSSRPGVYVIDFNACYSPACAYSDHYNCPIPTRNNRLAVAIRAGEKDPHYH